MVLEVGFVTGLRPCGQPSLGWPARGPLFLRSVGDWEELVGLLGPKLFFYPHPPPLELPGEEPEAWVGGGWAPVILHLVSHAKACDMSHSV